MTTMATATFENFFKTLATSQRPALVWYSVPGERIELSGRVLENWVAKTANFLVDECELASGQSVDMAVPTHWRSVILALAALRVGARLNLGQQPGADSHLGFTFDPSDLAEDAAGDWEYVVAVERAPLAPRFMGQLPEQIGDAEVLDYAGQVRSFGDVYSGLELPDASSVALTEAGLTSGDVLAAVTRNGDLLRNDDAAAAYALEIPHQLTENFVLEVLTVLAAGAGVVMLDPSIEWADDRRSRVVEDEQAHVGLN
ncbi:TIGR03089 family protein [Rothia sp. LK2588]|uniref:TIGR03089 family protein n=1 Tax=Rothia sp. LK2588 TaxID=3114369 RepID=UPI0034CF7C35